MAEQKNPCGCGCVPLKQNDNKTTKEKKEGKKVHKKSK